MRRRGGGGGGEKRRREGEGSVQSNRRGEERQETR